VLSVSQPRRSGILWQIIAQIPLGSSRIDTTRSTRRAHAFWLCRACRTARLDWRHARHDELDWLDTSNVSCRVETWPAKWNLGLSAWSSSWT